MKNLIALVTAIAVGLSPSPATAALEAHWKLQDNAASTTVVATVGTNGSLNGAGNTSASSVTGPGNLLPLALTFDGSNDRIFTTTGNSAATQNRAFITLSCWFYVAATTDTTTFHDFVFCGNGESGAVRAYIGMDTDGKVRAAGRAGIGESAYSKLTTAAFDDATWHHAAAVFDYAGDAITIYVDGVAVSQSGTITFTATASGNSASLDMEIAGPGYFKGRLADCRIYSSDETANISTIMADGVATSSAVAKILLQFSDARLRKQSKHFDTYGVYALTP